MKKITIIVGLSGSGKSHFINYLPFPKWIFGDWGWEFNIDQEGNLSKSFKDEYRFSELITKINKGYNIILEGSFFCNHKFLCEAEYYLNLNFPGIEITKYYFENNPKDAIANILYREHAGGNHWKRVDGELIFVGHHYTQEGPDFGRRNYEVLIENVNKLSKNYIIPTKYTPLKIQVQDEKFYQGWEALMRE